MRVQQVVAKTALDFVSVACDCVVTALAPSHSDSRIQKTLGVIPDESQYQHLAIHGSCHA